VRFGLVYGANAEAQIVRFPSRNSLCYFDTVGNPARFAENP